MKTAKYFNWCLGAVLAAILILTCTPFFGITALASAGSAESAEAVMVTGNAAAECAIAQTSTEYVGLAENQQTLQDYLIELQRQITLEKEQIEDETQAQQTREKLAKQTRSETWEGSVLTKEGGINVGPSGRETYYNLNMSTIVATMESMGIESDYWVRDDGVKMYGDYIMCAADLSVYPRGSIIETSLGTAIVCDTGSFVYTSNVKVDIATAW